MRKVRSRYAMDPYQMWHDEIKYLEDQQRLAYANLRLSARAAVSDTKAALSPQKLLRSPGAWAGVAALAAGVGGLSLLAHWRSKKNAHSPLARHSRKPAPRRVQSDPADPGPANKLAKLSGFLIGMLGRWMVDVAPLVLNRLLYPPSPRHQAAHRAAPAA